MESRASFFCCTSCFKSWVSKQEFFRRFPISSLKPFFLPNWQRRVRLVFTQFWPQSSMPGVIMVLWSCVDMPWSRIGVVGLILIGAFLGILLVFAFITMDRSKHI